MREKTGSTPIVCSWASKFFNFKVLNVHLVGFVMVPQKVARSWSPDPVKVTLYGKKGLEIGFWVKSWQWRDYQNGPSVQLCASLQEGGRDRLTEAHRRQGEDRGRTWDKCTIAEEHQQPPEAGEGKEQTSCRQWSWFPPSDTDLGLLASRTVRDRISVFVSHLICGTLLEQPQGINTVSVQKILWNHFSTWVIMITDIYWCRPWTRQPTLTTLHGLPH